MRCSGVVVSPDVSLPPFERVLDRHRVTVMRFLLVAVGPADADDVFQETFLAALRAYPRCIEAARLDRWLLRIASRKAIDHHRRTARRPTPVAATPNRAVATHEPADDALWAAVAGLPPRQRVAVVHRHVLDRPYAEIADLLGCSQETARAHVYRGTKKLRELMT